MPYNPERCPLLLFLIAALPLLPARVLRSRLPTLHAVLPSAAGFAYYGLCCKLI